MNLVCYNIFCYTCQTFYSSQYCLGLPSAEIEGELDLCKSSTSSLLMWSHHDIKQWQNKFNTEDSIVEIKRSEPSFNSKHMAADSLNVLFHLIKPTFNMSRGSWMSRISDNDQ